MAYYVLKYHALKAHKQINRRSSTSVLKTFPPLEIPKSREILKHLINYSEPWDHKKRLKEISKSSSSSSSNYAEFIADRYLFIHSFTISNYEVSVTSPGNSCASLTIKKYFFPSISNLNYSCCNLKPLALVTSITDVVNGLFLHCINL